MKIFYNILKENPKYMVGKFGTFDANLNKIGD